MSASTEKKKRQAAREAGTDKKMLAAQEALRKHRQSRLRWTLGIILVILLIAAILIFNWAISSGYRYRQGTALTIGDRSYSAAEVNYSYANQYMSFANQYGSYASIFGLDTSAGLAGLDSQSCPMLEDGTWKDYFLDAATDQLLQNKALTDYAAANGIALTEDEIAEVDASFDGLEEYAKSLGYANANSLLSLNYGSGVTQAIARQAQLESSLASKAYNEVLDGFTYTAEELEEYYQGLEGSRDLFTYTYYHVLAETEAQTDEDGETVAVASEQSLAEARAVADAIAAAYQDGEEEDVAERFRVAVDSQLEGEAPAESRRVSGSSLDSAYQDWLMDSRETGDLTVVPDGNDEGYYVVLYLERDDNHYPVAQVRHILVMAEADEDGTYTDEAKAAAKARAEEILAEWEAGEKTEESFAALAELYSEDSGSNTNGGLYDAVSKGQMVEEFDAFCFDEHQPGDTAIVYGESTSYAGYHVMYYVGQGELYSESIARSALSSEAISDWLADLTAGYEAVPGKQYKLIGK
ncbi:MAG: peptidylprolyl isomerase [Oscillospiraceae bacterium]|nr:peptidylprolyl isomerase [Oscillospiraceae bacterium]